MSAHLDIGMAAWDRWTRQFVHVVAGAQAEGYVTVAFDGGPVAAIRREHLTGYTAGIPVGAWRVLARREGRSFSRLGGRLTDSGPVEAGTLVTVEDITGETAYVRTRDGRELRVMQSNLIQSPRKDRTS